MKVLSLSYWYPPANIPASTRAVGIAQELQGRGFEIEVLAIKHKNYSREPWGDTPKVETSYIYDNIVTRILHPSQCDSAFTSKLKAIARLFAFIDYQVYSSLSTCYYILTRARSRRYDFILCSSPPFSFIIPAIIAKHVYGCRLIFDIRDTWAGNPYRSKLTLSFLYPIEYFIQFLLLLQADFITVVSNGMQKYLSKKHPSLRSRLIVCRNGVDSLNLGHSAICKPYRVNKDIQIVYTGNLYSGKRIVSPLLDSLNLSTLKVTVTFYGSEQSIVTHLASIYSNLNIIYVARVDRTTCLRAQAEATVLLLLMGSDEINSFSLPAKFYEYVAAQKPILSISPPEYEVSRLITCYKLGLATTDMSKIMNFLDEIKQGRFSLPRTIPYELTRSSQVDVLVDRLAASAIH